MAALIAALFGAPTWALPDTAVQPVESIDLDDMPPPDYEVVVLQGLNKVTGHISRLDGLIGTTLRFDTLEIVPRRCWKSPPDSQPENAAILDIYELKPGEDSKRIFLGWMFSSSPGLSALEHPVYDIMVVNCERVGSDAAAQ